MEIRFLDTFAFMASSLDKLVENLKKDGKDTKHLRQIFKMYPTNLKMMNNFY